jgi:hypothetical protein
MPCPAVQVEVDDHHSAGRYVIDVAACKLVRKFRQAGVVSADDDVPE